MPRPVVLLPTAAAIYEERAREKAPDGERRGAALLL